MGDGVDGGWGDGEDVEVGDEGQGDRGWVLVLTYIYLFMSLICTHIYSMGPSLQAKTAHPKTGRLASLRLGDGRLRRLSKHLSSLDWI